MNGLPDCTELPSSNRWWLAETCNLYNGVFQGGGAKGLAYAGALRAFYKEGGWFAAAAGSSAGALTATLIAAGLRPDEMIGASRDGLRSIQPSRRQRLRGHAIGVFGANSPLYPTDSLRTWLEEILRARYEFFSGEKWDSLLDQQRDRHHGDVTFADLYRATCIDLFVVALDISDGIPIVLSRYSAPDCQVSWATIASSSIPAAMASQELVVPDAETKWRVAKLVDGGGWANYPKFVFDDASFGAFHGIATETLARQTVGFVLTPLIGASVRPEHRVYHFVKPSKVRHRRGETLQLSKVRHRRGETLQDEQDGGARVAAQDEATSTAPAGKMSNKDSWRSGLRHPSVWLLALAALALAGAFAVEGFGRWVVFFIAASFVVGAAVIARAALLDDLKATGALTIEVWFFRVASLFLITAWLVVGMTIFLPWAATLAWPLVNSGEYDAIVVYGGVIALTMALSAVVVAASLLGLTWRFSHFLARGAAPTLKAVTGAATKVPEWLGHDTESEYVLRVPVEPWVETTEFDIRDETLTRVVRNAEVSVRKQIRKRRSLDRPPPPPVLPPPPAELVNRDLIELEREMRGPLLSLLLGLSREPERKEPSSSAGGRGSSKR